MKYMTILLLFIPLLSSGQSIVREVDEFTDEVTIKANPSQELNFINIGGVSGYLNLYWQSTIGYYLILTTTSDDWIFLDNVGRDNAVIYVIADEEKFRIGKGSRVGSDVNSGYVIEQYGWYPDDSTLQKLINARTLRMRLGTFVFPEIPHKVKNIWRAVYNAGKEEANH